MTKAKLAATALGGTADDTEAAFYEALQNADLNKLMNCWADEDEVLCVHPGGHRLMGSGAIRAAFETLFANGPIRARPERVRKLETMTSEVHSVVERVEVMTPDGPRHGYVMATNVYHRTAQGWRMVAHHASPGSMADLGDLDTPAPVLH